MFDWAVLKRGVPELLLHIYILMSIFSLYLLHIYIY